MCLPDAKLLSHPPREIVASLWRHRSLIHASAKREVLGRYRGSAVGLLWSFFNPLFMLAVYTFVFSVIFQARWGGGSGSKTEFALLLFAGLIMFNLFAECNWSPVEAVNLVLSHQPYPKTSTGRKDPNPPLNHRFFLLQRVPCAVMCKRVERISDCRSVDQGKRARPNAAQVSDERALVHEYKISGVFCLPPWLLANFAHAGG